MRRKQNLKQLATLSDPRPYVLKQCDCAFDQDEDGDTSVQWCNLHAAAPAMLEACKGMLEWARRVKECNPGLEILNAINAVAKAEGRL